MTDLATPTQPQGFEIDFGKDVEIAEIYILPVSTEEDAYRDICLFTDVREDALFCSDHDYLHLKEQNMLEKNIHFVQQFKKTFFRMTTRKIKLVWTCDQCSGMIRELEIAYRDLLTDGPSEEKNDAEALGLASLEFPFWYAMNVQEEGSDRDIYPFDPSNQGQTVDSYKLCAQNCYNEDACMVWTFMRQTGKCWIRTTWPTTIDPDDGDSRYTANMVAQRPMSGHRRTYVSNMTPVKQEDGVIKLDRKIIKTPHVVYKWNRAYEVIWAAYTDFTENSEIIFDLTSRGRRSANRTQRQGSKHIRYEIYRNQ